MAKTTGSFEGALSEASGRTKQALEKGAFLVRELTELSQGNAEALTVSSKAAAAGLESLGRETAEIARRNYEEASAMLQSSSTAKSPVELLQLQSEYARSAFGSFLALSTKFSESMAQLGTQIAEPLASRCVAAAERVKNATLQQ